MVSYGLLAELTVNGKYRSGELATGIGDDDLRIDIRVLGPHWTSANHVQLWANGVLVRETSLPEPRAKQLPRGVHWIGGWTMPRPSHDVNLVAIATGKGIEGNHWRTAKPYQPTSLEWPSLTIGCSGAVWLDIDKDGLRTSARAYAEQIVAEAGNDFSQLVSRLSMFDEAVAAQSAYLLNHNGTSLQSEKLLSALKRGTPATQAGFQAYREENRQNELLRSHRN